jgi:hypothetical protein
MSRSYGQLKLTHHQASIRNKLDASIHQQVANGLIYSDMLDAEEGQACPEVASCDQPLPAIPSLINNAPFPAIQPVPTLPVQPQALRDPQSCENKPAPRLTTIWYS